MGEKPDKGVSEYDAMLYNGVKIGKKRGFTETRILDW